MIHTLQRKLWRTIWSTWRPFLALMSIVAVGMTTYYGLNNTLANIEASKKLFYEQTGFADYYFEIGGASSSICDVIRDLPGVAQVTGRLIQDIEVERVDHSRTTARIVGYPEPLKNNINGLFLKQGTLFDVSSDIPEVTLDSEFASSNDLNPGSSLTVLTGSRRQTLKISGIVTSPELTSIQNGPIFEYQGDSFGIIMMSLDSAQKVLEVSDKINQILVNFTPGSNETKVSEEIEKVLSPYGLLTAYPRREHPSDKSMQEKLDGLKMSTAILPTIIFLVGLAFLYIQLGQLIKAQRLQIGIMKALGYSDWSLILFYEGYAFVIALLGVVIGSFAGTGLSSFVLGIYNKALGIPVRVDRINLNIIGVGSSLFCLAALLSGLIAAKKIMKINPAEAIRPLPPSDNGNIFLAQHHSIWRHLSGGWKMTLRFIHRNRLRFLVTSLGITAAIALLVIGQTFTDSKNFMLEQYFHVQNSFDYTINFKQNVSMDDIADWKNWPEIRGIEPAVRVAASLKKTGDSASINENLTGISQADLKGPLNNQGQRFVPSLSGIIVSQRVADRLSLQPGDMVEVSLPADPESTSPTVLKVMGICPQYIGSESFLSITEADRLLHQENVVNTLFVRTDPEKEPLLKARLQDIPSVASLISAKLQEVQANDTVSGLVFFALIVTGLAFVMGFSLIYNSSVINFGDRVKEVATLRVIGYSTSRISMLFLNELCLALILGAAAGLPFGRLLARLYIQLINTEFFHYIPVTSGITLVSSVIIAAVFAFIGHTLAMRRLTKLDIVETLKEKS